MENPVITYGLPFERGAREAAAATAGADIFASESMASTGGDEISGSTKEMSGRDHHDDSNTEHEVVNTNTVEGQEQANLNKLANAGSEHASRKDKERSELLDKGKICCIFLYILIEFRSRALPDGFKSP
jgi:hypothetical protein